MLGRDFPLDVKISIGRLEIAIGNARGNGGSKNRLVVLVGGETLGGEINLDTLLILRHIWRERAEFFGRDGPQVNGGDKIRNGQIDIPSFSATMTNL